ncbi:MAG: hypothetical protein IPM38_18110 [Ignavibacteria bacterium]|nr:hypothetical protein [Ignavibacteria bacterium]
MNTNHVYSQSQVDFKIDAGCDLSSDAKGRQLIQFIQTNNLQPLINNSVTTEMISVYYNPEQRLVDFGKGKQRNLDAELEGIFANWSLCFRESTSEDDVEVIRPKETKIWEPLTYIPERIAANWSFRTTFDNQYRNLSSMDYYVNPYIQAFGGDPLGIPISYGSGVGLTLGLGTPYSGPMETDYIKGGLHFTFLEVAVTSRVKEFVLKYSSNSNQTTETPNTWLGNWNNIYTPHLGIEFSFEIPFARVSYFSTIDTLQDITDNPIIVLNEVTGQPMKNNVVRGEYFGFEIRTPNLIFYNSTRAKFYFAKQFGEYHLGFTGREMKVDDFIFDFRMDATFPGKREFQLLTELYLDSPWEGFANKAFGFGPSIRLGNTPADNFGIISAFINFRLKIGDFFDKNIY